MDTLDRLDLLELEGESPWPDVDDGDDFYPIDWRAVDSPTPEAVFDRGDTPTHDWERIESEIRSRIRPGGGTPPPVVLDALGWYQPIHYFGLAWGIYIKEEAVLQLAIYLFEGIPEGRRSDDAMLGVLRMALRVVYLHEAFHHRIEWFATALEIVEREKRYTVYHDTVFKPLRTAGSDALLEEALATAESVRRLIEGTYRRGVPPDVFNATRKRLSTWIKGLPPGYNRADEFKSDGPFEGLPA